MNRRHRAADYLDIVARVRAARPDIALSSDFIVGYPGETDADFEETLALVRAVGFASSYAFKYSPRPGNARRRNGRPGRRSGQGARGSLSFRRSSRSSGRRSTGRASGGASRFCSRSPAGARARSSDGRPIMQSVFAEGPQSLIGAIADVEIVDAEPHSLRGALSRQRRKSELYWRER